MAGASGAAAMSTTSGITATVLAARTVMADHSAVVFARSRRRVVPVCRGAGVRTRLGSRGSGVRGSPH